MLSNFLLQTTDEPRSTAIPENRELKKWKFSFFGQRQALLTSFDIFVITYRVTNFLPNLVNMLLFSMEKTGFPFLFFPYFPVVPRTEIQLHSESPHQALIGVFSPSPSESVIGGSGWGRGRGVNRWS